jgi:hypothetical protein
MTGVSLTDEGLHQWEMHKTGQQLKGGSAGFSRTKNEVNRPWSADKTRGEVDADGLF